MKRISFLVLLMWHCCNVNAGLTDLHDVFTSAGDMRPYIQASYIGIDSEVDSGGFNTVGGFANTGGDISSGSGFGGAVGFATELSRVRVRTEIEGLWREDSEFVTSSFPGPPGPITFFYQARSTDNWSAMSNMWFDAPIADRLWVYGGGGIGASGMRLSINDTVVFGESTMTQFAYQIGTGLIVPVGDTVELDLGYRFFDLGSTTVALDGGTSGNYTLDMMSHQLMVSLRLYVP